MCNFNSTFSYTGGDDRRSSEPRNSDDELSLVSTCTLSYCSDYRFLCLVRTYTACLFTKRNRVLCIYSFSPSLALQLLSTVLTAISNVVWRPLEIAAGTPVDMEGWASVDFRGRATIPCLNNVPEYAFLPVL